MRKHSVSAARGSPGRRRSTTGDNINLSGSNNGVISKLDGLIDFVKYDGARIGAGSTLNLTDGTRTNGLPLLALAARKGVKVDCPLTTTAAEAGESQGRLRAASSQPAQTGGRKCS